LEKKDKQNNNSILQNIIEYFYFNDLIDEKFKEFLEDYGITKIQSEKAIDILENPPYTLIRPEFVYMKSNAEMLPIFCERYIITEKGKSYIEDILTNEKYYTVYRNNKKLAKSNRSYYLEKTSIQTKWSK